MSKIKDELEITKKEGVNTFPEVIPDAKENKRGRPKEYEMQNGVITSEHIFLYVPKRSLESSDINRFLRLCDLLIMELGPKDVTETDVKDIASLYRDVLARDYMYEGIKNCSHVPDKSMMLDLEKISKQIDSQQGSLKVRAKDRVEERRNRNDVTMMDILGKFEEDSDLFGVFKLQQDKILKKYEESDHTDVDEYMTIRTANSQSILDKSGEGENE